MTKIDKKQTWNDTLESIKVSVSPAIFSTWFSQTHLSRIKKQKKRFSAEIGCPSSFIKNTIENRYYGLIQDSLTKSLGKKCDLSFVVKDSVKKNNGKNIETPLFTTKTNQAKNLLLKINQARLRNKFTFKNFAVSSSNQMAWAASDAVSKNPGTAYNPLFLWGGVGVGKTHLINAVGYKIIKNNSENKIRFCTGEEFTNDIVEGIRKKSTQNFRKKYRKLSVLLIDDIQFIAGKNAVQEEFFHTFNALVSSGSQVILASDRPPSEISKLEERLRSRFEAGLIVDIAPPDFELRCAIIQIKAKERKIELPMDIIQVIAGNIHTARKIEGVLVRLSSELRIKKDSEINEELIKKILGRKEDLQEKEQIKKVSPEKFIIAVGEYYSIGKRALLGKSRMKRFAFPRQVLMYLLRTQLNLPLQEVGRLIGGRDHTTVMYAVDKITTLASKNVQTREDISGIKKKL